MAGWSEGLKTAQGLASKANTATGGYLLGAGGGAAAGAALGGAYGGLSDNGSVAGGLAGGALLGAGIGAGINAGFRSLGSKKVGTMTETVSPTVGATTASPAVRDVAATAGAGYQGTLPRGTNLAEHRAQQQAAQSRQSQEAAYNDLFNSQEAIQGERMQRHIPAQSAWDQKYTAAKLSRSTAGLNISGSLSGGASASQWEQSSRALATQNALAKLN